MDEFSYCGVCCALCPSYSKSKTCLGCKSTNRNQKRISKWSCRLRTCAMEKGLESCAECEEFPCILRKKLDKRYLEKYNIDLVNHLQNRRKLSLEEWAKNFMDKYICPDCDNYIDPYTLKCYKCN